VRIQINCPKEFKKEKAEKIMTENYENDEDK
jgi:hypothetical protein